MDRGINSWAIHCIGCTTDGPIAANKEEARVRWNQRAALTYGVDRVTQMDRVNLVESSYCMDRNIYDPGPLLNHEVSPAVRKLAMAVIQLSAVFQQELEGKYGRRPEAVKTCDNPPAKGS